MIIAHNLSNILLICLKVPFFQAINSWKQTEYSIISDFLG